MFVFPDPVRKAYEALPQPLVIEQFIDEKVVPLLVSDGFCRLVGKNRESTMEWFFGSQYERVHPDDVGNVAHVSDEFAHHRGDYNVIFRAKHEEGYHYIHAVGEWMTAHDGTELAVLIYTDVSDSGRTITKLADQYDLFKQDVFYSDPVTGLPNRNYFNRFGEDKLHAIRTAEQTPALIICDINAMKSYNSQYGYEKGDDLIRLVASLLRESFPEELLVRGSEDQLVLLVTLDNRDQLIAQLEEVNRRVRQEAFGNTTGIQAGIRVLQPSTTLLEAADQARHALRMIRSDLNTVCCFYSQVVEERYWQQLYVIQNIDKAVENGWIKVYYQGIAETVTGNSVALEALARWVDPVRGIISPADFIPVLMKYHQLHKLDLYMFEQVCREVSIRKDAGLPLLPVSVNFARQDFDHINMVEELNRIVDSYQIGQYGIGKDYFIIEITEQDIATAPERFYDQLKTLRADGFKQPPRKVAWRVLEEAAERPRRELPAPGEVVVRIAVTARRLEPGGVPLDVLDLAADVRRAVAEAAVGRVDPRAVDLYSRHDLGNRMPERSRVHLDPSANRSRNARHPRNPKRSSGAVCRAICPHIFDADVEVAPPGVRPGADPDAPRRKHLELRDYVAGPQYERDVARLRAAHCMRPRLLAAARKPHVIDLAAAGGVEVGDVAALHGTLKRRIGRAEDDLVGFRERRRELIQKRLRARIAMRLEENAQRSDAYVLRHFHRARHLRRMVGVVGYEGRLGRFGFF